MSSDHLIEFEESNFEDLIDKFLQKYNDKWAEFVMEEYANSMPEPDLNDER